MRENQYTIADIVLQTEIEHGSVLELEINFAQGEHGRLTITMEVDEAMESVRAWSYIGTNVSVNMKDGHCIFAGICKDVVLNNQASYKTVRMTAYTSSVQMDEEPKNKTFQSPSKTLGQVADTIAGAYGATISLDADCPLPQVLFQKKETDWQFLKRIAAAAGKTVFADIASSSVQIYVGKLGFRSFTADVLGEKLGSVRDVGEMARAEASGEMVAGYMYDTSDCYCSNLTASAGDKIDEIRVVKASTIRMERGVIKKRITHAYKEGIHPTFDEANTPATNRSVLTGTVKTICGNEIQVELDTDGGAGDMVWVPYESYISNSFYCMPDEGDTVFLYYENNGNIVCLGSKHTSTDSPDFDKPKEDVLTNHDKMIKLGEKKVSLTATRQLHDAGDPAEVSVIMENGVGITVQSGRDIVMETDENMNLYTGNTEGYDELYEDGKATLESRHKTNEEIYKSESGEVSAVDFAKDVIEDTLKTQGKKALDMAKGMVMFDLWAGLFGGKKGDNEDEESEGEAPLETGVATLYGYEKLILQVDKNSIMMDTENIHISTDTFKWLGYDRMTHAAEELPLQDWWETALDGLQFALDIAGCIPVFGAIPDLINAGVSLMRGNFAEAAMSAVSAIPGIGDAVGAAKIAGKSVKIVSKAMTKAERIVSILQGLYVAAQATFSLYQMKDGLADMWERWKNGENIFANPGDVSMLFNLCGSSFMALRGAKGVGEGLAGKKLGLSFDGDTTKTPDVQKPKKSMKDNLNGLKEKFMNLITDGAPVDVVTGSFLMKYRDLQLRDVAEPFSLRRTFESVYENMAVSKTDRRL